MAVGYIQVCTDPLADPTANICNAYQLQQVSLVDPIADTNIELLYQGGFSSEVATTGFLGMLLLWAVGLGIGLIIRSIFRLR